MADQKSLAHLHSPQMLTICILRFTHKRGVPITTRAFRTAWGRTAVITLRLGLAEKWINLSSALRRATRNYHLPSKWPANFQIFFNDGRLNLTFTDHVSYRLSKCTMRTNVTESSIDPRLWAFSWRDIWRLIFVDMTTCFNTKVLKATCHVCADHCSILDDIFCHSFRISFPGLSHTELKNEINKSLKYRWVASELILQMFTKIL